MKLQIAFDRMPVEHMLKQLQGLAPLLDVAEVGTSLIKDYGLLASVGRVRSAYPALTLLADTKTADEGAYEFARAFEAGADIATALGCAADATLRACANTARAAGKVMLLDLLETSPARVQALAQEFPEAIFCVHLAADDAGSLAQLAAQSAALLRGRRTAAAGGVTLAALPALKSAGYEIGVVGGAILRAPSPVEAARAFCKCMGTPEKGDCHGTV